MAENLTDENIKILEDAVKNLVDDRIKKLEDTVKRLEDDGAHQKKAQTKTEPKSTGLTNAVPSATLLPNGKQQFLDVNGDPLSGGSVTFYVPDTTTYKDTWQDEAMTILNTNPVLLDAGGWAVIYGSGEYRQVVKNVFGDLIWDQPTSDIFGAIEPFLKQFVQHIATKTDVAAITDMTIETIFLDQSPFQGIFQWLPGDQSAFVSADPNQGDYIAPASAPSGSAGAWVRVRRANDPFLTTQFTDDINSTVNICNLRGGGVVFVDSTSQTLVANNAISMGPLTSMDLNNHIIDVSQIPATSLINGYAVVKNGNGLTEITGWSNITAGDSFIVVPDASAFPAGSIICIWDGNVGSFLPTVGGNGGQNYYYRGQRARVTQATGTSVYLDQTIRESYLTGGNIHLYIQSSTNGFIQNGTFTMKGTAATTGSLANIKFGDGVEINNVNFLSANLSGVVFEQCYQCNYDLGSCIINPSTTSSFSFPVIVLNSANTTVNRVESSGPYTGLSTGGRDSIGAIQNYGTVFRNCVANGKTVSGVQILGNSEFTTIENSTLTNGVVTGGKDCMYNNCTIIAGPYKYVYIWGEMWGGRHEVNGGSIVIPFVNSVPTDPFISGSFGGSWIAAKAETFAKIHTNITAPQATNLIGFLNDSPSYPVSHDFDIKLDNANPSLATFLDTNNTASGLFAECAKLRVYGLPIGNNVPFNTTSTNTYRAKMWDYPTQSGSMSIFSPGGVAFVNSGFIPLNNPMPLTGNDYNYQLSQTSNTAFGAIHRFIVTDFNQFRTVISSYDATVNLPTGTYKMTWMVNCNGGPNPAVQDEQNKAAMASVIAQAKLLADTKAAQAAAEAASARTTEQKRKDEVVKKQREEEQVRASNPNHPRTRSD